MNAVVTMSYCTLRLQMGLVLMAHTVTSFQVFSNSTQQNWQFTFILILSLRCLASIYLLQLVFHRVRQYFDNA